jgi:drug/metabolite transporter (DMT)-like permease
MPALTLSTLMSVFGLALAIGPAGVEIALFGVGRAIEAAVMGVVYYALVPTVIGYLLWYAGAARTSAGEAALFTAVLPVSARVLAAVVLGEPITVQQGIGCVLVVVAIVAGMARPAARSDDR